MGNACSPGAQGSWSQEDAEGTVASVCGPTFQGDEETDASIYAAVFRDGQDEGAIGRDLSDAKRCVEQGVDPSREASFTPREADGAAGRAESMCTPAVHMLICALDYKESTHPLTCSLDGQNMLSLAHQCGVTTVKTLFDEKATVPNVTSTVRALGKQCRPGDYFVFFYAGHGINLEDNDGDEEGGKDDVYCFVDSHGRLSRETLLRDDDFAKLITSSIPKGVKVVLLSDCCHSGTIADFDRTCWEGHEAISISGCTDSQTSGDVGYGGIFTHAMLLAIEKLDKERSQGYSTAELFKVILERDDHVFHSPQEITLNTSSSAAGAGMAWPLVPRDEYTAPYTRRKLAEAHRWNIFPSLLGKASAQPSKAPAGVKSHSEAIAAAGASTVPGEAPASPKGCVGCLARKARR
mmetsp:Transcript_89949/g.253700  ORF Transcript_89949/g.253700 Transcript_89949/m.253700 type:complete len:408 (+) Transcript_89949:88-1311(+)